MPGMAMVIVPAGRLITSAPEPTAQSGYVAALLLALMTASRNVQTPFVASESPSPLTVMVFARREGPNALARTSTIADRRMNSLLQGVRERCDGNTPDAAV